MVSKMERLEKQYSESIEKAKLAKATLEKLRTEQNRKDRITTRKARNHAIFQVGGLVDLAGLLGCDKGALLGGLLAVGKILAAGSESSNFRQWKQSGDALLSKRETERKMKATEPANT